MGTCGVKGRDTKVSRDRTQGDLYFSTHYYNPPTSQSGDFTEP